MESCLSSRFKVYKVNGVSVARDGRKLPSGSLLVPFCEGCKMQDIPLRQHCKHVGENHDPKCTACCKHYTQCPVCSLRGETNRLKCLLVRRVYSKSDRKVLLHHLDVCKYKALVPCSSVRLSSQEQGHGGDASGSDTSDGHAKSGPQHLRLQPCLGCDNLVDATKAEQHLKMCDLRQSDPSRYKEVYHEHIRTRSDSPPSILGSPRTPRSSKDGLVAPTSKAAVAGMFSPIGSGMKRMANGEPTGEGIQTAGGAFGSPAKKHKANGHGGNSSTPSRKDSLTLPRVQSPKASPVKERVVKGRILDSLDSIDLGAASNTPDVKNEAAQEAKVKSAKSSKKHREGKASPSVELGSDDERPSPSTMSNENLRESVGTVMRNNGLKAASVCKDTGIAKSTFNDWLHGKGTDAKGTMRVRLVQWMQEEYKVSVDGDGRILSKRAKAKAAKAARAAANGKGATASSAPESPRTVKN